MANKLTVVLTAFAAAFLLAAPIQASTFNINLLSTDIPIDLDMGPVQVSSPVTMANFDPGPPSWVSGASPSFYAVEFNFTVINYTCDVCADPSLEVIRFDGDLTPPGSGAPSQSIGGSTCEITLTSAKGNGVYDTGLCLVNGTDVTAISNAFKVGGANILSIGFQGPGNAPQVGLSAASVTFFQTVGDVSAPEPATLGLGLAGLALCYGVRRLRRASH